MMGIWDQLLRAKMVEQVDTEGLNPSANSMPVRSRLLAHDEHRLYAPPARWIKKKYETARSIGGPIVAYMSSSSIRYFQIHISGFGLPHHQEMENDEKYILIGEYDADFDLLQFATDIEFCIKHFYREPK